MFKASEAAFPSHRKTKSFEEYSEKTKKRRRIEPLKGFISEEDSDLFKNLCSLTKICNFYC